MRLNNITVIFMYRFIVNILLVVFLASPLWGRVVGLASVGVVNWNGLFPTKIELECDTTATDTLWTMTLEGNMSDGDLFLIKTGDNNTLELRQYDCRWSHITDSIGHNSITGEIMDFYHYEQVLYYYITTSELEQIAKYGISKMRCGTDAFYKEITYKNNEFGRKLIEAYKKILYKLSPDYVPPKKPSIRDGF